jgi:hypothetical protein
MSKSKRFFTATAAAAVLAVVAAQAVSAGAAQSGATPLSFTAKATSGMPVDVGRKGISPGDQFLERGVLTDADGHAAGHFQMVTQLVSGNARRGSEQTALTLELAGGEIEVVGGHVTTSRFVMPVVGGTGSYASAAGTLTIAPGRGESEHLTVALGG